MVIYWQEIPLDLSNKSLEKINVSGLSLQNVVEITTSHHITIEELLTSKSEVSTSIMKQTE